MKAEAQIALAYLAANDTPAALATLGTPREAGDYAVLGMAGLQAERWDAALVALTKACALGDGSAVTQLNLAIAEDRSGLDGRARMRALIRHCPDWDDPPLRLAESYRRAGNATLAITEYERTICRNPNRTEALLGLGILHFSSGDLSRAQMLLLRCCAVAPRLAEAWDALGVASLASKEAYAAEAAFAEAFRMWPNSVTIAVRRVEAAIIGGTAEAELNRLEVATDKAPLDTAQLTARGILLDRIGRSAEASDILETAVLLAPDAPVPAAALAISLLHANRFMQAVPALRRAAELAPHDVSLGNDHAAALNRVHRYREGKDILERLIAEHGERPALLCNLCNSLVSLGMQQEGVAMARHATELAPELHLGWRTLASALSYCDGVSGTDILAASMQAGATLRRSDDAPPQRPTGDERKLRIGLLSPNLRTHPVGWLTLAAFEALDAAEFEIVCFANAPSEDLLNRRFRSIAAEYHHVIGQPAATVASSIRAAGIDILIDLGGWGDNGTLPVCALRPAPVQIKWVGMQNHSSGLTEMDWFISDRWETPEGSDFLYSERLLRLPDGYICYSAPPDAPEVSPLPATFSGRVTFGCFNNMAKITPATIAAWARVLHRVQGARLLLKTHQFSDQITADWLRSVFSGHDVDPSRVETRGSSSHRGQLAQHADIDLVLDPFPYSGGLTTCEALWMGVPVVTMSGESFASRHSTSHLSNAGLADWVAPDVESYVNLAAAKAADIAALARLRAELRGRLEASPLCDAPRFARNFGAALRHAWRLRPHR